MNRKLLRIISAVAVVAILVTLLSSCDLSSITSASKDEKPVEVSVKTDLKDAKFDFTYATLRTVMEDEYPDKLAELFTDYDEITDESTITLSYNDIVSRFGEDSKLTKAIMGLLPASELAKLTANTDEVLEYFVSNLNNIKTQKPIVEYNENFWVENDTIKFTQNGTETDSKVKQAAEYFSYFVTKGVTDSDSGLLKKGTTNMGDDLSDVLYLYGEQTGTTLTKDDIVSVVSSLSEEKQIYTVEEEVTDKNGKTKKQDVEKTAVTGITRTIVIVLKDGSENVKKAFSIREKDGILEEMKKGASYFTVDDYDTTFNACRITATFNAVTDEMLTLSYDKNMVINTAVTGVGSLEYLGVQDLEFECTDNMYYHFGWASEAE